MVHGAVRTLLRLLEALALSLLLLTAAAAWRLSRGPVDLDFLTPYMVEVLSAPGRGFQIELDRTELTWAGWERALDLRAVNVRAILPERGVVASVPQLSLSLSARALVHGMLAPRTIELIGARVRLHRTPGGAISLGLGEAAASEGDADSFVDQLYRDLVDKPDPRSPAGHLTRVSLIDAEMVIEDDKLGLTWRAPDTDLLLVRDETGVAGELKMLVDAGGELASVEAHARYRPLDGELNVKLDFANLHPDVFARLSPVLAPLNAADLPLAGSVQATVDREHGVERAVFTVSGAAGVLRLPEPIATDYPVAGLQLAGHVADQPMRAVVDSLRIDLGGPVLTGRAAARFEDGEAALTASAELVEVPVDALNALWPAKLGKNARDWVVKNLSGGVVRHADIAVAARRGIDGGFVLEKLGGTIRPEGVTVDYLSPMPKVRNARAVATYDHSTFTLDIDGGEVYGLKVRDGKIVFTDLEKVDQFADIQLQIDGPLNDALVLLDHQPLGYTSQLGISPKQVRGSATVDLRLTFPLELKLKIDDVEVFAKARTRDATLPKVLMGLDLSKGNLELTVDSKGMDVTGPMVLGTIPGQLAWRENFSAKPEFRSRYRLQAVVQEHQRRELRLDGPPFVAPWISGPVRADVTATMTGGGTGRVVAKVDLEQARMEPPGFGWVKPSGVAGAAEVELKVRKEKLVDIPRFSVRAADLVTDGSVDFDPDGAARRVSFERLRYGRTDVQGELLLRRGAGVDVALRGASFDAAPLLSADPPRPGPAGPRRRDGDDLPPMSISGSLGRLWIGKRAGFDEAVVDLSRDGRLWRTARLEAPLPGGRKVEIAMAPAGGTRRFSVTSPDAGAVFRSLDIFDNMRGGDLVVRGTVEDTAGGDVFEGKAEVSNYEVVNAPVLARVLTVAALTGIVDLLRGGGISFSDLDAPFRLKDGLLELTDTRAFGPALGLTAKGQVDLSNEKMAVEGTIVPMYMLNSAVGNIPVIGRLLTGEKGGGIFAATFTITGPSAEPDVTVNPLAALAPGFLRKFFDLFTGGAGTTRPEDGPPPQPPPPLSRAAD